MLGAPREPTTQKLLSLALFSALASCLGLALALKQSWRILWGRNGLSLGAVRCVALFRISLWLGLWKRIVVGWPHGAVSPGTSSGVSAWGLGSGRV